MFKVNNNANVCGTSLKGYITTSYTKLVQLFGEPVESDGYKVSGEWLFEDNKGNVFTIYDWKATALYDSGYNPTVEEFRQLPSYEFHIGGNNGSYGDFLQWLESELSLL